MKRSKLISLMIFLLVVPATLILGSRMDGRWYYLTSTLMIAELLIPFFLAFEGRKPQARELVVIAVMCALAVVARVAIPIPSFKAIFAIIMIAGIAFGPESGFLVGAVSALASNFFYTQGPYTPWQMMAYGVGGFLAGCLFGRSEKGRHPVILAIFGFFSILLLVGPLLDCCTLFTMVTTITRESVLLIFLQGFPANLTHSLGCAVTMLLFSRPLLEKLTRLKMKYGMLEM